MSYQKIGYHKQYEHQADAVLSQANPVSTTEYTVLDTQSNVRIIGISATVTWTVQPTPLNVYVYIDGQTYTFTQANPASGTGYYLHEDHTLAAASQTMNTTMTTGGVILIPMFLEGKSVKVTAKTTGGTVQNLTCRVRWSKKTW